MFTANPNLQCCIRCGFWADPEHFSKKGRGNVYIAHERRAVCIGCEQEDRDEAKQGNPWFAKARSTLNHHAKRFKLSATDFCQQYGWTVPRLAHMLEHAFDNTCPYCWMAYKEMRNQLADITIDIIDPAREPWLRTNVQPCCRTCNTAKSNMAPERWERRLRFWRERRAYLDRIQADGTYGLPLFQEQPELVS
jgi:hypothetical protein